MARPRKTSGRTSFGKQSDAEKSFYKRKKTKSEDRFSDDRRGPRSDKKKFSDSYRSGDSEGGGRPFNKSSFGSRTQRSSSFSKRPIKKSENDDDKKRSFKGSSNSFGSRREGFASKGKRSFKKGHDAAEERPFKSSSNSFGSGRERFSSKGKRSFKKREGDGGERSFKSSSDSFGPAREKFSSKGKSPFKKQDRDGDDRPFKKDSSSYGRPYKKKPYLEGKRKSFIESRLEKTRGTKSESVSRQKSDSDLIRLNKFLANAGVGSRREADEYIKMGLVTVNGVTITEMGHKVKPTDDVRYEGKKMKAEKLVYILLNKPKGFITTTDDPQERNTVMSLVASACKERIYPVGRLDRNTTGLLLLTNDGDLADKLTHPSYNAKKIYKVELDKPISKNDFQKIQEGVHLEEGRAVVDDLAIVSDDKKTVGIELHIGWNRIVRRIFEALDYQVVKLDRVVYAGLDKKDLGRGQWRFLKPEEVVMLKHFK
jgi:23S rRNA pseudouridine2605 synthase